MQDNKTSKPLPFTSLGVHKRKQFSDAQPCLFVFDLLHFNGANLMTKWVASILIHADIISSRPMSERRTLLEQHVVPVKNQIMLSESQLLTVRLHLFSLRLSLVCTDGGRAADDDVARAEGGTRGACAEANRLRVRAR